MSEYTIDVVKADIGALGKNVMKIRKYIRDHQAQLQQFSTNMLNQAVRPHLPAGMMLKRNYGVLSLRSTGNTVLSSDLRAAEKKKKAAPPPVEDDEDESDDDEEVVERTVRQPLRRPVRQPSPEQVEAYPQEYYEPQIPHYMLSNEDLARNSFIEVAKRKWRRFA